MGSRNIVVSFAAMMVGVAHLSGQTGVLALQKGSVTGGSYLVDTHVKWGEVSNNSSVAEEPVPLLLRFQLITPKAAGASDAALGEVDAVLKDLFKFPAYRAAASAAVLMDFIQKPDGRGSGYAHQMLSNQTDQYSLDVTVDSTTPQGIRVEVRLTLMGGKEIATATTRGTTQSQMVFLTKLTIGYGKTVVLGSTDMTASGNASEPGMLILVVKPELRKP